MNLPPAELRSRVGGVADYGAVGTYFATLLREKCGLLPEHDILDVGCGAGRLAIPLTGYLTSGTYVGFDVHKPSVKWCQEYISTICPNFTFSHADVQNGFYSPEGRTQAADFIFPYADASLDRACAVSLFTHMLEDGAENYLREARRVLKPGSVMLATFFLAPLDEPQRKLLETLHQASPSLEAAVVYSPNVIERMYRAAGFLVEYATRAFQDILVLRCVEPCSPHKYR